jgi:GT2 family glycosyltransferase
MPSKNSGESQPSLFYGQERDLARRVPSTDGMGVFVVVLMACHNRASQTLRSLAALKTQSLGDDIKVEVLLVDDGSTDDTSEKVSAHFPDVHILHGDGSLFWNRAMHLACKEALVSSCDFVLWLNDDAVLYPDALQTLLNTFNTLRQNVTSRLIIVGALCDPVSHTLSYSGWREKNRWYQSGWVKIVPSEFPLKCDSMNGNCVLISQPALLATGNLDPVFTHSMGDADYGFRARRAGCDIWLAPGFVGECQLNDGKGLWTDSSLSWGERLCKLLGPKGFPPKEWFVFTRRHSGPFWFVCWISPYMKFCFQGLISIFHGRAK